MSVHSSSALDVLTFPTTESGDGHSARVVHVRVRTKVRTPSQAPVQLYVIYRVVNGSAQPFLPLIRFFLDRGGGGRIAWQRTHASSVMLLLDHLAACDESGNSSGVAGTTAALQRFVDDLLAGTLADDGSDPTGLGWRPRASVVVEAHLSRVNAFSDWLSERTGAGALNPWRTARPEERLVLMRRVAQRSSHALLGHAAYRQQQLQAVGRTRSVQAPRRARRAFDDVKTFHDDAFLRLLKNGWSRRGAAGMALSRRYRLRDLLITLLLHAGGLRVSEVFHLYVGDVVADPDNPGTALVRLFDPVNGEAPAEEGGPWRDRAHYLCERWNRLPRTLERGGLAAGWKHLALTDARARATQVFWFPAHWGAVFWQLFGAYLRYRPPGRHPFLFVSERAGPQRGEPYTVASFEQAHRRAVRRAGLNDGKHHGTSPHGHRHAYGLALADAGVDRRIIQRSLHHRSPSSQDVYTAATAGRTADVLSEATRRLFGPGKQPAIIEDFLK